MKHHDVIPLLPAITPPVDPRAEFQDVVATAPLAINLPLLTDEAIERALEQELAA